jgi:hypothetical protein
MAPALLFRDVNEVRVTGEHAAWLRWRTWWIRRDDPTDVRFAARMSNI